jgi:hypothetical protein
MVGQVALLVAFIGLVGWMVFKPGKAVVKPPTPTPTPTPIPPTPAVKPPIAHTFCANGARTGFMEHEKVVIDLRYLQHGCSPATGSPASTSGMEDPEFTQDGAIYSVKTGFRHRVSVMNLKNMGKQSVFAGRDRHLVGPSEWRSDPIFVWMAGYDGTTPPYPYNVPDIGWPEEGSSRVMDGGRGCTPLPMPPPPDPEPSGEPNTRIVIEEYKKGEVFTFSLDVYVAADHCNRGMEVEPGARGRG